MSATKDLTIKDLVTSQVFLASAKEEYWKRLKYHHLAILVFNEPIPLASARRFQHVETMRRLSDFFHLAVNNPSPQNIRKMTRGDIEMRITKLAYILIGVVLLSSITSKTTY